MLDQPLTKVAIKFSIDDVKGLSFLAYRHISDINLSTYFHS